jgi:hypothetical protein
MTSSEVSGAMLIKTVPLHTLPCVVVIASSMAANQIPWAAGAAFQSDISMEAVVFNGQIVNRAGKSDRLPVKRAQPRANDIAPVRMPAHCKPPTDVLGRCFANFRVNQTAA